MNQEILNFIKEMRRITGETFYYEVCAWEFSQGCEIKHRLGTTISGFELVNKETAEEIIRTFDLIRSKVELLMKSKELTKQIETKMRRVK